MKTRESQDSATLTFAEVCWRDFRYFLRMYHRNLGITTAAVFTFALGIGVNTAIFSVVYSVLWRSLPYADPSQLVSVSDVFPKMHAAFVPHPSLAAWRDGNHVFSGVAAHDSGRDLNLRGIGDPKRIAGIAVSANIFSVLGIQPTIGRSFLPEEDTPGAASVILSHNMWAEYFDSSSTVVTQSLVLDDRPYRIVGVLPDSFQFPFSGAKAQLFVPLALQVNNYSSIRRLNVIARLKPGTSIAQAAADLSSIDRGILAQYPAWFRRFSQETKIEVIPLRERLVGDVRPALIALILAAAFVLFIACANVSNLQLIRASSRRREIALRAVLGASKRLLARQLLTESTLLALLGGTIGLVLALSGLAFLRSFAPKSISIKYVTIDHTVLLFSVLATVLTGLLTALMPLSLVLSPNLTEAIRSAEPQSGRGRHEKHFRNVLVVAELAAAILLLTAAGLLLKSFVRLSNVTLGFSPQNLLVSEISLPITHYSASAQQAYFFEQVLERVRQLPGVESAAVTDRLPPDGQSFGTRMGIAGRPLPATDDPTVSILDVAVSPGYFRTMGISLLSGRDLTDKDDANAPAVVVVNKAFIRRYFSDGENPLGEQILYGLGGPKPPALSIVGVVSDARNVGLANAVVPEIFRPFVQHPDSKMYVVLRSGSRSNALVPSLRKQILEIDKAQPIYNVATMQDILGEDTADQRFNVTMIGFFASIALAMAAIGTFGVVSYAVNQRTREIGLRMALGAQPRDVLRLVMHQSVRWAFLGILIGNCTGFVLMPFLQRLLFDVRATDSSIFCAATLLLALIALAACYLPGRRASRLEPLDALRYE